MTIWRFATALLLEAIALLTFVGFYSCNSNKKHSIIVEKDTSKVQTPKDSVVITHRPVFGYRFVITGDFDGDGRKERLVEHYYSGIDNKETYKFDEGLANPQ
jgi:hypothetical protein